MLATVRLLAGGGNQEAIVLLAGPQVLSDTLVEIASYGLTSVEYTVREPISSDPPYTHTYGLQLEPPFTGTEDLPRYTAHFWNFHQTDLAITIVELADEPGVQDAYLDALSRITATAGISGCWDSGTCPAVSNVYEVGVIGSASSLSHLEDSSIVESVLTESGFPW